MPQVNTLAIDIAPSNDYSSAQSEKSAAKNSSSKDFSQVIDQHYQAQQSGKKSEASGNNSKNSSNIRADKTSSSAKTEASNASIKDKSSDEVTETKVTEENNTEQVTAAKPSAKENADSENHRSKDVTEQPKNETVTQASVAASTDNSKTSAEQLISLLSASEQILSSEGTKQESESKLQEKNQPKTDIDALLRQVLIGNDKKQNSGDAPTDKSNNTGTNKSQVARETNNGSTISKEKIEPELTSKDEKNSKALVDGTPEVSTKDKVVKGEVKDSDLSTNKALATDKTTANDLSTNKALATDKTIVKSVELGDRNNTPSKPEYSTSAVEALLTSIENTPAEAELAQAKALFLAEQEKVSAENKGNTNSNKITTVSEKPVITSTNNVNNQTANIENVVNENGEVLESIASNKAAFAGVSVSGEKQAQESNQNHSRVNNQATQKVIDQQALNSGDSSKEQSSGQQNKNTSESIISPEKLAANEIQMKEKPFSELFDKKLVSTGVENTINRNIHQVNEATRSTASVNEMLTTLASETAQSTAQSVTNAKQVASLQNEALSVYRKDFAGAVKDKVMVMMNQKLQQIEIRLDPQELGNVNVKINLQNEQAVVSFTVQNQQAKEALDQNLGRLKEMLAESGVDVGDANVEQQNKQNGEEQHSDSRGGDGNSEELSGLIDTQTLNLVKGSSTGVDYYA
jgi:flagellar hook-length control protein FliK